MNKVSVIIALYNHAPLVVEAIESVLSQTYKNIEIIVVDDGSTDNAREVIANYIETGKIKYIYQNNQGLSAARNTGIKAAKGKYIKFLDSDDFLYPEQIEHQINDIIDDDNALSVTDHYTLLPNGEIIRHHVHIEKKEQQLASFMEDNRAVVHAFLIPKNLIEKECGFDEALTSCEDWDLWVRILRHKAFIKRIPFAGCCYRISESSMSADTKRMFLQRCVIKEKVNALLLAENNYSPFLKDVILTSNVRKIEEGITRQIDLNVVLPNTLRMTDLLIRSQISGMRKVFYRILGLKRYSWVRYLIKKILNHTYESELLNETNLYRYGEQSHNISNVPDSRKIVDRILKVNNKGIILMYHRVTNLKSDPWQLHVTPNNFEDHMRILRKYGRLLNIQEIGRNIVRFNLKKKEIAVTFDDGYVDNFLNAKPILERYEIPATFFIVSGAVGMRQEFWWDELERIVLSPLDISTVFHMTIAGKHYQWKMNSGEANKYYPETPPNGISISRKQLYFALWTILSQLSYVDKWQYLHKIALWAGDETTPRPDNFPMSIEQLSILAQSPHFEIGAHTRFHPILSKLKKDEQYQEIRHSKEDLEKILNKQIKTFAYPHGEHNETTVGLMKDLGFEAACAVYEEPFKRCSNVFSLPRFNVLNWDGCEFEKRIQAWLA